jgi:hypothetical protein
MAVAIFFHGKDLHPGEVTDTERHVTEGIASKLNRKWFGELSAEL